MRQRDHVEALGGSIEVRSEPRRGTEVTPPPAGDAGPARRPALRTRRPGIRRAGLEHPRGRGRRRAGVPRRAALLRAPRQDDPTGRSRHPAGRHGGSFARWHPPAIVLASATRSIGVACDRVLGDRELVVKGLGPLLAGGCRIPGGRHSRRRPRGSDPRPQSPARGALSGGPAGGPAASGSARRLEGARRRRPVQRPRAPAQHPRGRRLPRRHRASRAGGGREDRRRPRAGHGADRYPDAGDGRVRAARGDSRGPGRMPRCRW